MTEQEQRSEFKWWCSVVPIVHYTVIGLISMSTSTLVAGNARWSSVLLIGLFGLILHEWFEVYDKSIPGLPDAKTVMLRTIAYGVLLFCAGEIVYRLLFTPCLT